MPEQLICEHEGCDQPGEEYIWPYDPEDAFAYEVKCPAHKSPETYHRDDDRTGDCFNGTCDCRMY